MKAKGDSRVATSTLERIEAENSILGQILQMEVPINIQDLYTLPHLKTTLLNTCTVQPSTNTTQHPTILGVSTMNPMLLALNNGQYLVVIEMGILGTILTDMIVDVGSRVNVLPEETCKKLGKPTPWSPTFNLLGVDQHVIKPLGTLMAQPVTIAT